MKQLFFLSFLCGGSRITVTELVTDRLLCIINVYMPRNSRTSDSYEATLLQIQEIIDKYLSSLAVIVLGDMNSSLIGQDE